MNDDDPAILEERVKASLYTTEPSEVFHRQFFGTVPFITWRADVRVEEERRMDMYMRLLCRASYLQPYNSRSQYIRQCWGNCAGSR